MSLPEPDCAALRGLLKRLSAETGDLAGAADRLQHLFGRLMAAPQPPGALEDAQALDELVQRLQGLATYLATLGEGRLGDLATASATAAAALPLARQGRRLAPPSIQGEPVLAAGDYDLF